MGLVKMPETVRTFDGLEPDKEQALKPLEEAAEVFGAWQRYGAEDWKDVLLDECADVIQATLNLASAIGVEDFTPFMEACERRNRKRGRFGDEHDRSPWAGQSFDAIAYNDTREDLDELGDSAERAARDHDYALRFLQGDGDAARWVHAHGGLEEVRAKCYLAEETARTITGKACGESTPNDILAELQKRLMPEGMEWPRYEDGEPVRIGDEFAERIYGNPCKVGHFAINKHAFLIFDEEDVNDCEAIDHGTHKCVKRPAVPAADGEPLERDGDVASHMFEPSQLTHTKPEIDSWEKWREEFIKPPRVYCRDILGVEFDDDTELDKAFDAQIQDMERRAKALAERGE